MPEMLKVEIFVVVDDDGNYAVGADADAAAQSFEEGIGTLPAMNRLIRIDLEVEKPAPLVLAGVALGNGQVRLNQVETLEEAIPVENAEA